MPANVLKKYLFIKRGGIASPIQFVGFARFLLSAKSIILLCEPA